MENINKEPVEIKNKLSTEEFRLNYLEKNKPVVLRGLWDGYPAREKWSVSFFKEELGDINVGVFDGTLQKNDRSFKAPDKKMKFSDYLDAITSGESTDLKLFLFNIFKYKPELRQDFGFPKLTRLYLKKVSFMFFGGKDSIVRLHQDMDWSNVFLTQLHGRKKVVLFAPEYSRLLYRYPFNVHSSVDIEKPDFIKYPGLRFVKGMECILEPGDTLFMPSGFWHYIRYIDGGFAINQRALNPNPAFWFKGLWHVLVLSNVDELMRFFMGKDWFARKENMSITRAEDQIARLTMG